MASMQELLNRILTHYEKKEYQAADKAVDELIRAHPDLAQGRFLKAVILEETGRATEAEEHYAHSGNKFTLWSRLAMQLQDVDPERAVIYYDRVLKMDPENNLIRFNLGTLHEKRGRTRDAAESFRGLQPLREVLSRILIPIGFLIIMLSGAFMMMRRGDSIWAFFLIASSVVCILWLKRDGGKAVRMWLKKKQYK